jgi:hypothetical protein
MSVRHLAFPPELAGTRSACKHNVRCGSTRARAPFSHLSVFVWGSACADHASGLCKSGATRSKRTLKRLGPRVSSDRCRARCCHELRQEVIHDGAAAANGLPTCATPLRQPPEAEAATAEQTSQLRAALVKQHQQSAHGPGARGCTRKARSRRTFAACDQKKARRARVRVSVRAVLGLYACNRVASEAASTRLVANCSPRSPHHRFPSGRPSAKARQEHQK